MDFAKKQLESMGWKEGKGLGRNEDGISKPLKLMVQKDSVGLGFDRNTSKINTEVWFQELDQVIVEAKKGAKRKDIEEIATDKSAEMTKRKYNNFVVSKVSDKTGADYSENGVEEKAVRKKKRKGIDLNKIYSKSNGVTCHRSAHCGITMSGKMKRLLEQDEQFKLNQ